MNGADGYNLGTITEANDAMTENNVCAGYGYIDYVFYLKATSDAAEQDIKMTECNLIYNNGTDAAIGSGTEAGSDIDRAWRIGVFAADIASNSGKGYDVVKAVDPAVARNQIAILGLANSAYFTKGKAQAGTASDATGLGDVVNFKNP